MSTCIELKSNVRVKLQDKELDGLIRIIDDPIYILYQYPASHSPPLVSLP